MTILFSYIGKEEFYLKSVIDPSTGGRIIVSLPIASCFSLPNLGKFAQAPCFTGYLCKPAAAKATQNLSSSHISLNLTET